MRASAVAAAFLAQGCLSEAVPKTVLLAAPPAGAGFQVSIQAHAPARSEIWRCEVFYGVDVGDDRLVANVNRVVTQQSPNVHHADLMTFFYTGLTLKAGQYDCTALYAENPELMEQGLFIFGSQEEHTEVTLPPGTVAQVPTSIGYMYEVHYVNTTDNDVEVESYLNGYVIADSAVTNTIYGGVNRDRELNIPPGTHSEWTRCVFSAAVDVLFISSHTHQLGASVDIKRFDGTDTLETLYQNDDWHRPLIAEQKPPLHFEAGEGVEYACHFNNITDSDVHWGLTAADEMCQIGYAFTPGDRSIQCTTVETSDGVLP